MSGWGKEIPKAALKLSRSQLEKQEAARYDREVEETRERLKREFLAREQHRRAAA